MAHSICCIQCSVGRPLASSQSHSQAHCCALKLHQGHHVSTNAAECPTLSAHTHTNNAQLLQRRGSFSRKPASACGRSRCFSFDRLDCLFRTILFHLEPSSRSTGCKLWSGCSFSSTILVHSEVFGFLNAQAKSSPLLNSLFVLQVV